MNTFDVFIRNPNWTYESQIWILADTIEAPSAEAALSYAMTAWGRSAAVAPQTQE